MEDATPFGGEMFIEHSAKSHSSAVPASRFCGVPFYKHFTPTEWEPHLAKTAL